MSFGFDPPLAKKKKRVDKDSNVREYWAADTLQEAVGIWGKEAGIEGFSIHSGGRTFLYEINN